MMSLQCPTLNPVITLLNVKTSVCMMVSEKFIVHDACYEQGGPHNKVPCSMMHGTSQYGDYIGPIPNIVSSSHLLLFPQLI